LPVAGYALTAAADVFREQDRSNFELEEVDRSKLGVWWDRDPSKRPTNPTMLDIRCCITTAIQI